MPWRRPFAATFALLTAALSCDGQRTPDEPVEDGWGMARGALLDGTSCYAGTPLLCLEDEDFVDGAIEAALENRWKGEMPKTRKDVERVISSARTKYKASLQSAPGLKKLERLAQERYDNPSVDLQTVPGVAALDLGALPGELRSNRRGPPVVLSDTQWVEKFDWKPSEAGRQLATYADKYPQAEEIRLEVRNPSYSTRHYVYRFLRKQNVVVHTELESARGSASQYVSKPIEGGLDTLRSGGLRLGKDEGRVCYPPRRPGTSDCRVDDRYGAAQKKARDEARGRGSAGQP
ncbi:MAG: hypothetical protein ACRBN8_01620 [Nannocystales bacterium]